MCRKNKQVISKYKFILATSWFVPNHQTHLFCLKGIIVAYTFDFLIVILMIRSHEYTNYFSSLNYANVLWCTLNMIFRNVLKICMIGIYIVSLVNNMPFGFFLTELDKIWLFMSRSCLKIYNIHYVDRNPCKDKEILCF